MKNISSDHEPDINEFKNNETESIQAAMPNKAILFGFFIFVNAMPKIGRKPISTNV